jgi:hypothetical protein
MKVSGTITKTIINGQIVFDGENIIQSGIGKILKKQIDFE